MLNLIKKELALCIHPTTYLFLSFSLLVFVPNYPYEVIFFFPCLAVFFCCMKARENGDIAFSCALPVKKRDIPLAKMLVTFATQGILLLLVGALGAIKGVILPEALSWNQAGISANLALVGNGAVLLGVFHILYFPRYFQKPERIGSTFVLGAIAVFVLIGVFIVLRWATPLYSTILNGTNGSNTPAKVLALTVGLAVYTLLSAIACAISMRRFQRIDI